MFLKLVFCSADLLLWLREWNEFCCSYEYKIGGFYIQNVLNIVRNIVDEHHHTQLHKTFTVCQQILLGQDWYTRLYKRKANQEAVQ